MSRPKIRKESNAVYYQAVAKNMLRLREQAGLSRREAAMGAGLRESVLYEYETQRSEKPPTVQLLVRLAELYGVQFYQFLEMPEEKKGLRSW